MTTVGTDDAIATFSTYYDAHVDAMRTALATYGTLLAALLSQHPDLSDVVITSRVKKKSECIGKFRRKYQDAVELSEEPYVIQSLLTDLLGIRVVCPYEPDIGIVRGLLEDNFNVIDITDKTAEVHKQERFGYMGLHLDVKLRPPRLDLPEYLAASAFPVEIQVRTLVQDAWSQLDHRIRYKRNIPADLRRRVTALAALFEIVEREFLGIREATLQKQAEAADTKPTETLGPLTASEGSMAIGDLSPAVLPAGAPQSASPPLRPAPLDSFRLEAFFQRHFPVYRFSPIGIEDLASEILRVNPSITEADLENAHDLARRVVRGFKKFLVEHGHKDMSPFTKLRHYLYYTDQTKYRPLLSTLQADNFNIYLAESAVGSSGHPPSSI